MYPQVTRDTLQWNDFLRIMVMGLKKFQLQCGSVANKK